MTTYNTVETIFQTLLAHFGPQHWWPGDSPFEVMVGAVLTQNTNWSNVEKALQRLKDADVLSAQALYQLEPDTLAGYLRPAGYFRLKTQRLRNLLRWLIDSYDGDLHNLASRSWEILREELLAIKGIGPETADSILLYAMDRPVFVVDAYTARVAVRHGLIEPPFDYHELQELFVSHLPQEVKLFNEFHALLVALGKDYCKPKPRCENCPLAALPRFLDFEN
ncbi:endonuclease III domain-containing protein [Planctomycetota bacterium]